MNWLKTSLVCCFIGVLFGCSRSEAPKSAGAATPVPTASASVTPTQPLPSPAVVKNSSPSSNLDTKLNQAAAGEGLDLSSGAKEALQVAANRAVDELTGPNGFQKNLIPLPATVERSRPYLKALGREDLLTSFSTAMNSAAANAIKQSPAVLNATLQGMQLSDVTELWHGQSDAFTRYLEKHARSSIVERMMPSIKQSTEASGATRSFKQITSAMGDKGGGLLAGIQSATGVELPGANFNLDNYVADQAMNNLFNFMAVEEKKLRENPAARSSQLLKSLFSRFEKH